MSIYFGCDHAGFNLKNTLLEYLTKEKKLNCVDMGCYSLDGVDYPDFAAKVCVEVLKN